MSCSIRNFRVTWTILSNYYSWPFWTQQLIRIKYWGRPKTFAHHISYFDLLSFDEFFGCHSPTAYYFFTDYELSRVLATQYQLCSQHFLRKKIQKLLVDFYILKQINQIYFLNFYIIPIALIKRWHHSLFSNIHIGAQEAT